ncbi:MAG: hypothetical protein FWF87_07060 [Synergistaceae bacterium]|nr:hypothetical protein [Synergistaceae bacterium]
MVFLFTNVIGISLLGIVIMLLSFSRREIDEYVKRTNGLTYELRTPMGDIWIYVAFASFFFAISIFCYDDMEFGWLFYIMPVFALMAAFSAVWFLKRKISVKNGLLTISKLFRREIQIRIEDITTVNEIFGWIESIEGLIGDKKIFAVGKRVTGFELFYTQLRAAGKLESTQIKKSFSVRPSKSSRVYLFVIFLASIGYLYGTIFMSNETVDGFHIMFFLVSFCYFFYSLRWKLIVIEDTMTVRSISWKKESYSIKEITKVQIEGSILLFINDKKIAEIGIYSNIVTLLKRLSSEGIPFYKNDRIIDMRDLISQWWQR